jgi:hypothetical protein
MQEATATKTKSDTEVALKKVPSRAIHKATELMLWGRAGGRCQFNGCNRPVWKNGTTQEPVNIAQKAHIYSFSEDGPRGNDGIDPKDINSFENLLLLCHACHKTIDDQEDGGRYPVELLQQWKAAHEHRVECVTGIDPDHHSHVLLYGRGIGDVDSPLRYDRASAAMFPHRYPAEERALELGTGTSEWNEWDAEFWRLEEEQLIRKFERLLRERLDEGDISHLSVFALAPMPLLIRLGTLLTDIRDVEVFQLHRKPKGWKWPMDTRDLNLTVKRPETTTNPPALVISLSATIEDERIHQVLGDQVSIWRVTIPQPNQECIRSRTALSEFYLQMLALMDEIKSTHGHGATLSIFPAAPVSAMVELGRARQPKADMNWIIFDELRDKGGFVEALRIGTFK